MQQQRFLGIHIPRTDKQSAFIPEFMDIKANLELFVFWFSDFSEPTQLICSTKYPPTQANTGCPVQSDIFINPVAENDGNLKENTMNYFSG